MKENIKIAFWLIFGIAGWIAVTWLNINYTLFSMLSAGTFMWWIMSHLLDKKD